MGRGWPRWVLLLASVAVVAVIALGTNSDPGGEGPDASRFTPLPAMTGVADRPGPAPTHLVETYTVRFVDPFQRNLPNLPVEVRLPGLDPRMPVIRSDRTDAHGEIRVRTVAAHGDVHIRVLRPKHPDVRAADWSPLAGRETLHRVRRLRELTVRFVGSEFGDPVEGVRVRLRPEHSLGGALQEVARGEFVGPIYLDDGPLSGRHLHIEPPKGYVAWSAFPLGNVERLQGVIGAYTRHVAVTIPLYREARIKAELVSESRRRLEGPLLVTARLGDRFIEFPFVGESTREGWLQVPAVPHLPGEPVELIVVRKRDAESQIGWGRLQMPLSWRDTRETQIELGRARPLLPRKQVAAEPSSADRPSLPMPFESIEESRETGALSVRVMRRSGRPAVGATVEAGGRRGRTDARGRCRLTDVPAGPVTVSIRQSGFLAPVAARTRIEPPATPHLELREALPCTMDLLVTDETGRALPFAEVRHVSQDRSRYTGALNGRQQVSVRTDEQGQLHLLPLAPGPYVFDVRWGSRKATLRFTAVAGEDMRQTLVLPPR